MVHDHIVKAAYASFCPVVIMKALQSRHGYQCIAVSEFCMH